MARSPLVTMLDTRAFQLRRHVILLILFFGFRPFTFQFCFDLLEFLHRF